MDSTKNNDKTKSASNLQDLLVGTGKYFKE